MSRAFLLVVEQGYARGERFRVPEGTAYIGRGDDMTIRLAADGVSRRHARVTRSPAGDLAIADLDSRNGTLLNGVRCAEAALVPGDRISVGPVEMVLVEEDEREGAGDPSTVEMAAPDREAAGGEGTGGTRGAGTGTRTAPEARPVPPSVAVVLWGESAPVRALLEQVGRVAAADCCVLIRGETGTGKELIARAIHALSPRRRAPLLALNCASLDGPLLESELFGHERGAFTGAISRKLGLLEAAADGTLFLDEVGELSPAVQAKLLRTLESGEMRRVGGLETLKARCRVIAATNRDLETLASSGTFREDLLYRLRVVELRVPPLRERGDDVGLLVDRFFEKLAGEAGRRLRLSGPARAALLACRWPGNVRELRNAIERAVILAPGPEVALADLPESVRPSGAPPPQAPGPPPAAGGPILPLAELERIHIERALAASDGHRGRAAEILGIDRKTLYRKLAAYGLAADGEAPS